MTVQDVLNVLKEVQEPELGQDLVSLGMIRDVVIDGPRVRFSIVLTTPACPLKAQIEGEARKKVQALPGVTEVTVKLESNVSRGASSALPSNLIPGVKNTIAVASGKGGVGKSTMAVYLSVALAQAGAKVGLLDADIYGPNIPRMLGFEGNPLRPATDGRGILPAEKFGMKVMSMGFIVKEAEPIVWRGPLLHKTMEQFLGQVAWGELDYLVVDLPPGTGDVQLSLSQMIPLTGAVIVTTPQQVALSDVRKAIAMFKKVNVPLLGVVENMSFFLCPHCGERVEIFQHGGGSRIAQEIGLPFLGEVPLIPEVCKSGDTGTPVILNGDSPFASAFLKVAEQVAARVSVLNFEAVGSPVLPPGGI